MGLKGQLFLGDALFLYGRTDQNHFSILIDRVRLALTYTYDNQYDFNRGGAIFGVFNDWDYKERIDQK